MSALAVREAFKPLARWVGNFDLVFLSRFLTKCTYMFVCSFDWKFPEFLKLIKLLTPFKACYGHLNTKI